MIKTFSYYWKSLYTFSFITQSRCDESPQSFKFENRIKGRLDNVQTDIQKKELEIKGEKCQ